MEKVYIIMIHDKKERPYIHGVYKTRQLAEEICNKLNRKFVGRGCHADFISEEVVDDFGDLMDRMDMFV